MPSSRLRLTLALSIIRLVAYLGIGPTARDDRPAEEPLNSVCWEELVGHVVSISQTAETANLVEWAKLALTSPQAHVLRVTRILLDAPGRPIAFEEVVLVLGKFPGLTANGSVVPDITELAQRYGVLLGRASERMSIVRASKDVALHLGIAAGADVLKLDRIAETVDGEPVEWRVAFRKI